DSSEGPRPSCPSHPLGRSMAEVTCPLCLELFSQPVLAPCGHSLCSSCSRLLLGSPPGPAPCPQCRASIQPEIPAAWWGLGPLCPGCGHLQPGCSLPSWH
uniref:RING-type domain-containing protein n=1 Tax=Coturnix japonica TaxID=93934 RepID=A0A8C2TA22_COTJA